ncbi:DUF6279 family lipoprotein [Vibrio sp. WXL103]|uniref:DUF6279 family lipoprotein n=1 Tax=Vibrio sp. WXL103 TaxID=3450710 RepID=UPI003EC86778
MLRRILLLMMVCLLAGCGARLLYSNVDWFVVDYVEDYVELEGEQKSWLKQRVELLTLWHRHNEIPDYITHLDLLIDLDLNTFTAEQLQEQEQQIQHFGERILKELEPQLVTLVGQLSDQQASEFMTNLRSRHSKFQKKYQSMDDDELREVYAERVTENVEYWFGSVTPEQEKLIQRWASEVEVTVSDWAEYQTQLRIAIKQMLAERQDPQVVLPILQRILFQPRSYYSADLERKVAHNRQVMSQYLVPIVNMATERQSRHYREALMDWREVATDIAQN